MIDTDPVNHAVPTPETLQLWADELIPGDVWYWDDSPLELDVTGCQVMNREAYRSDPTYSDIRFMNAYCEWQMPAEATQVIVSDRTWVGKLSVADRQRVVRMQVSLKRGLVFSADWFGELPAQLQEFVVADQVVLGQAVWASLPTAIQHRALMAEQRRWDDLDCYPVPDGAPAHVQAIANMFSPHEGTNCFAITAYGANADSHLLATWLTVSPIEIVAPLGYRQVPDVEPIADDVVIFEKEGKVIHAVWCAGHDRFLNKNGQSRFNPIRIVDWKMLDTDWPDTTWKIYR
ncbi:MAG TPA: hypothetical protein VFQ54_13020, partial [Thermomicrobiales bacterium]|nr:hypothetical protein [Thermomicrobiales bacterium]